MLQFFTPYTFLDIQPLVDAVNKLAEPSGWLIAQTIISGIAVILSLVLALGAWRRSSWGNWLKINHVKASLLYNAKTNSVVDIKPKGVYLTVHITRNHEIPMKITAAYVWLNNEFGTGYKIKEGNRIFRGPINFQLVRTMTSGNQKMYEDMPVEDFYNERLKKRDNLNFKSGEIEIYTNVGVYKKKLAKKDMISFSNTFKEIKSLYE